MKKFAIAILLAGSMLAYAQDKAAPAPQLTSTEQIALQSIGQEFKAAQEATAKAQQDLTAFKADFAKEHPGWRFDEAKGVVQDTGQKVQPALAK